MTKLVRSSQMTTAFQGGNIHLLGNGNISEWGRARGNEWPQLSGTKRPIYQRDMCKVTNYSARVSGVGRPSKKTHPRNRIND